MSIAHFLQGKTIFITGATGFVGQPLVEKILFVAPDVAQLYVLIRPKQQFGGKEINAQQRLRREIYGSSAFDRLRSHYGERLDQFLSSKLVAVAGDISQDNLGLSEDDHQRIRETADIVINSAALVSFDAPLDEALNLNVMAAKRIAEFAASCRKPILIHVSTAYVSGSDRKQADESIYHQADAGEQSVFPPGQVRNLHDDIDRIQELIREVEEETMSEAQNHLFEQELLKRARKQRNRKTRRKSRIESLRKRWKLEQLTHRGMEWARSRGWNDTYTYTKALGEQMVLRHRGQVPTAIIRPSVIESSLAEPCPGWLDGLRMADPLIAAIGKGRLKVLPLNQDVLIDLVPVDVVVNALLAAIPGLLGTEEIQIYQVATGSRNPITLGELYDLVYRYFRKNPMLDKAGNPILIKRLRFPNPATFRFQHRLKTVPLKTAERTLEKLSIFESTQKTKRRLAAANVARQKLYYYGEIYEPYLNLDCQFQVDNTMALFQSLSEDDRRNFNFDVSHLNWRHYIQNVHIPGVKKFILKIEGAGTMEIDGTSELPVKTIPELVERSARRFPEKTALQIRHDKVWHRITYRQLWQGSGEIADRFRTLGLRQGDRVVLFSENQPEWGLTYLAAVRAGLVVVPLDAQSWIREVWSVVRFTEAAALLVSDVCLERLEREELEQNEASETGALVLGINKACRPIQQEGLPRTTSPVVSEETPPGGEIRADDPVSIIFTQGTMVDPRGAIHTHRSFLNNLFGVQQYLPIHAEDTLLSVLPLYHVLEFTCGFLMPLWGGASVTYSRALKPRTILALMRELGVTCMLGVPTLYALIRDDIERRILKTSTSPLKANWLAKSKRLSISLHQRFGDKVGRKMFSRVHDEFGGKIRVFVSGGSALGKELYEDFRALGMPVYEGYGLTETAPVLTVNPHNLSRPGSAGKPLPGVEVRLDHPDKDGVGEIVVRTPSLMKEYFRNPEATRAVVDGDWFHTGDLGWVDVGGYIYISGRKKEVIVTGAGKNVYPVDLEAIFSEVEGVREISVVGIAKGLTEEIHGLIRVGEEGTGEWSERCRIAQSGIQKLAKQLPSYHRIQQFHFTADPLPKAEKGIDRRLVRKEIDHRLQHSQAGRRVDSSTSDAAGQNSIRQLMDQLSLLTGVPVNEITVESDLYTDLGLDSLRAIEMLLEIEQTLGVNIPDVEAAKLQTVGDVLTQVQKARPDTRKEASRKIVTSKQLVASALPYSEKTGLDRLLITSSFSCLRLIYSTYLRLRVASVGNVPVGRPYIVAANHSSHLDTGSVISALHSGISLKEARRIHVLGARDYFFDSALRGWLVSRLLNVVPIERKESSLSSLRLVKSILSKGEPVLIYPEGTRSRKGNLQAFKPGLGLIAWELKVPILPVLLEGTRDSMPVGRSWPAPGQIRVTFGEPIEMVDYEAQVGGKSTREELYRSIVSDVRARIQEMQQQSEPK